MRGCETKNKKNAAYTTLTTSFIPRQLLLSSSSSKSTMAQQKKEATTVSLSSEDRLRLLQTVCQFLELNCFVKTLKKFRSEADIEDCRKNCSVNLEEMFQEYLRKSNEKELDLKAKSAKHVPYVKTDGKPMENGVDGDDIKPKKKKKNKIADDTSDQVEDTLSEPSEAVKKFKKKKQKDASEPMDEDLKQQPVEDTSEPVKKSKDKKKKHKGESEVSAKDVQEKDAAVAAEETPRKADGVPVEENKEKSKKSKEIKEDVSTSKDENEELGKRSKKRKQSSSDDTATGYIEESATDDPKRRKMDDSDNTNEAAQAQKIPDGTANGFLEKDGGQKALKQDRTKEHTGSSEPTSAKAFQRVKADQVEFIDDRLKNNSYWAKDGADSGYGAKAQEILGQVRGRDFRHEKTKKKRGSYRGGQIDLQSHSIKFNYDDDDE